MMRRGWVAAAVLALALAWGAPAKAQFIDRGPTIGEAAVSACAGGAAIGFLIVWGTGTGGALPTAALFCGLSVAATVSSSVAAQAWRSVWR